MSASRTHYPDPVGTITLQVAFKPTRNSLNALRLLLAVVVIVSHSWPVGGYGPDPQIGDQNLGEWAVAGFFVISGFLITRSRMSSDLLPYLWRRFLRIYPGFLVVLLVVAFLIAPISTELDGSHGYSPAAGLGYVVQNLGLFITQYTIEGTLSTVPYSDSWNGPLWTLGYEFVCYVMIGVAISLVPARAVNRVTIAGFALGTLSCLTYVTLLADEGDGFVSRLLRLGTYFLAGTIVYLYQERIPHTPILAVVAAIAVVLSIATSTFQILAGLPLAYLMMWAATTLPLHRVARINDISYGMYIYAFPVQQVIALTVGPLLPVWLFAVTSIAATIPLAWASWLAVERPALRSKRLLRRQMKSAPSVPRST